MHCLWCDTEMVLTISWKNILLLDEPEKLCEQCKSQLLFIEGKCCQKCNRMSDVPLCSDCIAWTAYWKDNDPLEANISVLHYNKQMQEMIAKWKYRGDYCIGETFRTYYVRRFQAYFSKLPSDAIVVPIPLSKERLLERAFNQSQMLADFLQLPTVNLLTRVHGEKQSKKTKRERMNTRNPFKMTETINKPVILTDDIYTTGSTIRHAAFILKKHGCPVVYSMTLAR